MEFLFWLFLPCIVKTDDQEEIEFLQETQKGEIINQDTLDLSFKIDLEPAIKAYEEKNK